MSSHSRQLAVFAVIAAGMLPATVARAQYYYDYYGGTYSQPAPFYPYALRGERLYAIEIVPNIYSIRRAAPVRDYPYVSGIVDNPALEQNTPALYRPHEPAERGFFEELRKRSRFKRTVINTTKIVRDKPVVIETTRVVDDPARVIVRRHFVEDEPMRSRRKACGPSATRCRYVHEPR
jgi:hypothetical protein